MMDTIPEAENHDSTDEDPDSTSEEKIDASTDTTPGVSSKKNSRVSIGRKLDPFLLRAILLKIEHKGLKNQFQHRKRVENFHRHLCDRYAEFFGHSESHAPEPVAQLTESSQVDPSIFETERMEQLAKRISSIKGSGIIKNKPSTKVPEEKVIKKEDHDEVAEKKPVKQIIAKITPSKASVKPQKKVNNPEQSKNARDRWQVAIGLILGLAKIAAFSLIGEKYQYKVDDLIFDPTIIKECKNAPGLSSDCRFALSLIPAKRTNEQVELIVQNLRELEIKSFNEYPESIQLKLARVARYEVVNQQRVIMKQGRPAEHFYFLIEGTVVAIEKGDDPEKDDNNDSENEAQYPEEEECEDLVVLRKGAMFGEAEMVNRLKRRVTVISKGNAELLSIARHELLKILEQRSHANEPPDHIKFLQHCDFADHWPVKKLIDNLDHCSPYFFKKNSIIVEDSVRTDFLVIIRSGQCRVIRKLHKKKLVIGEKTEPVEKSERVKMREHNDEMLRKNFRSFTRTHSSKRNPESTGGDHPNLDMTDGACMDRIIDDHSPPPSNEIEELNLLSKSHDSKRLGERPKSRLQSHRSQGLSRHKSSKMSKSKLYMTPDWLMDNSKEDTKVAVFIQIDVLEENEVFGLETLLFDKYYDTLGSSGLCLVSGEDDEGVNVVLLSKSYFVEHASEQVAWRVRRMMKTYPDTETLLEEIERQELWGVSKQGMKEDIFTGRPLFLKKLSWKF